MSASTSVHTIVSATGESLELPAGKPADIISSYRIVNEYLAAWDRLKKQLLPAVAEIVDDKGTYEHDGWLLRVTHTQRKNYDKAVLRQVFDEDELDLFLEPAKGRIDRYIRDHLAELGEQSTLLRNTMIPVGTPYRTVRLERLTGAEQ